MKYLSFLLIVGVSAASFFSSCRPEFSKELAELDSLRNVIRGIETSVYALDVEYLKQIKEKTSSDLEFLKKNYTDTSDREFLTSTLSDYYKLDRNIGKFLGKEKELKEEIDYAYKQLSNLKKDLNSRVLDKKKYAFYLSSEAEAIQILQYKAEKYVKGVNLFLPNYEALYQQVQDKMNELEEAV